jgi:hypothetical protein
MHATQLHHGILYMKLTKGTMTTSVKLVCVYLFAVAAPAADGTEDSELLKILTPELGSAAGTASRMRILTHQVQEAELQSSAAEMQVSYTCTIHLADSWKS